MKEKSIKSKWVLAMLVVVVFVTTFVAIDPTSERNSWSHIKPAIGRYIAKRLELTELHPLKMGMIAKAVKKTITGDFPADIETVKIEIKAKHLKKIEAEREQSLKQGIRTDVRFYPAKIKYRGETYKAKLRLKGDLSMHWILPDRWSFRVHLKRGKTIKGMSTFSLQAPPTRQMPDDMLFQAWMRAMGNLAPRHEYLRVVVNGKYWGVMDVEEHMSRHFLELAQRKLAPLFKIGSQDSWVYSALNKGKPDIAPINSDFEFSLYDDKRYARDRQHLQLFSYAGQAYNRFLEGQLTVEQVVDVDAFSRALIAAAAWNNEHTLSFSNMRFYVNPYTLKIEPVTTDQDSIETIPTTDAPVAPKYDMAMKVKVFRDLLKSKVFYDRLDDNLEKVRASFSVMGAEHDVICSTFPIDCPDFDFDLLKANLSKIEADGEAYFRRRINAASAHPPPALPAPVVSRGLIYPRHIVGEYYSSGKLVLRNMLGREVVIQEVRLNCSKKAGCEDEVLSKQVLKIAPTVLGQMPTSVNIDIQQGLELDGNRRLDVISRVGNEIHRERLSITLQDDVQNPFQDLDGGGPTYVDVSGHDWTIHRGDWTVESPLTIPLGRRLVIEAGTTLTFAPNAYLLSQSPVIIQGTQQLPVVLQGRGGETWGGIYVLGHAGASVISHAVIADTRAFQAGALVLTGGVTFYDADVTIEHVVFNNTVAEDALNTVNSNFVVQNTTFNNTISDAFDSDFSTGTIRNLNFTDIGGDGLDVSGTQVIGGGLVFENVFDKGVSAGEASQVTLKDIQARNVGVAVASKDASHLSVDGLNVENSKLYAGMVYIKKPMYGPAFLTIQNTNLKAERFFNQSPSTLVLNGTEISGQALDVDQLYSSGPMKKY